MSSKPPVHRDEFRRPPMHPGLGLIRVTEAAALAAGRWMGRGDRQGADHAAQDAMAAALNVLPMRGCIISGEEARLDDHSPLDSGNPVGTGEGPELDVEVNAIDGASLVASGRPGAVAVAALAPKGAMQQMGAAVYMEKLVVDQTVAEAIGPEALDAPPSWLLALVARQKGKEIRDLAVFVQDRPRHADLVREIRQAGARVILRTAGDIGASLLAAHPDGGVDLLLGIGGAAEGLMSACAVKALRGGMVARLAPQSEKERAACLESGLDLDRVFTCGDLIAGQEVFFAATGITGGPMLQGVQYHGNTVETHSLVLRLETGTRRLIKAEHRLQ